MHVPTDEQMLQMLEISGYTSEEMRQYVRAGMPGKASCISATHLVPSVCLLTRVLADAMMDKSEWQGYKKGKKNYTPTPNLSMQKLESLVEYMEQNDLLYLDILDGEAYTEFVCNHARFMCRLSWWLRVSAAASVGACVLDFLRKSGHETRATGTQRPAER